MHSPVTRGSSIFTLMCASATKHSRPSMTLAFLKDSLLKGRCTVFKLIVLVGGTARWVNKQKVQAEIEPKTVHSKTQAMAITLTHFLLCSSEGGNDHPQSTGQTATNTGQLSQLLFGTLSNCFQPPVVLVVGGWSVLLHQSGPTNLIMFVSEHTEPSYNCQHFVFVKKNICHSSSIKYIINKK